MKTIHVLLISQFFSCIFWEDICGFKGRSCLVGNNDFTITISSDFDTQTVVESISDITDDDNNLSNIIELQRKNFLVCSKRWLSGFRVPKLIDNERHWTEVHNPRGTQSCLLTTLLPWLPMHLTQVLHNPTISSIGTLQHVEFCNFV